MPKRALLIFAVSFVTVLLAGVAFAQVGVLNGEEATLDFAQDERPADELPDAEEPEEPKSEPADEKHAEEPKDEPGAEASEAKEPAEEPAEEAAAASEPAEEPGKAEPTEEATEEHSVWIEVLYPKPEQVVENKYVTFEGHVSGDTRVFRGKYEADVEYHADEGFATWRVALVLEKGENRVTFEAVGPGDATDTDSIVVIYEGPEEPKPGEYDFTAHQKYGECSESPPYDVFYGTGEPGTKVWIESAFGGGQTTISEEGRWNLKVKFWEAPCNDEIKVVLETSDGDRKEFWFMRVCDGKDY